MKTKNLNQQLGSGIYTIPEVAFILKLPVAKVRRWMTEFWDNKLSGKYNTNYSWGDGRDKATNFFTLIEFYVFYQLRELNVSTNKIFKAHQDMAEQLNTAYPFASSKVLSDGKSILFMTDDDIVANADKSRQIVFKEIIEKFCKKIEFSDADIAERFYPLGKDKHIIVDPHHQFGQPVIEQTNVLAQTLYELYDAGESIKFLMRLYNLEETDVQSAIELFTSKRCMIKVLIDENLSKYFAEGLNKLQYPLDNNIEVTSIEKEFQIGIKDEDWIPAWGEKSGVYFTRYKNILYTATS